MFKKVHRCFAKCELCIMQNETHITSSFVITLIVGFLIIDRVNL